MQSGRSASHLPPCGKSCVNSRNKHFKHGRKEPPGPQMLFGATHESTWRARHQAFQSLSSSSPVTMVSQIFKHQDKAAIPGVFPEELAQMAVQGTTSANAPRANGTDLQVRIKKKATSRLYPHALVFVFLWPPCFLCCMSPVPT